MLKRVTAVAMMVAACAGWSMTMSQALQSAAYGDARTGAHHVQVMTNMQFDVVLPPGMWGAFTVCGWFRVKADPGSYITTFACYAPECVYWSNPDLMGGAAGYPADGRWEGAAGTNLTELGGSVTVDPFGWQPYTSIVSNRWPKGVYTLAGWASNAVTVSVGGSNVTVGAGAFNVNAVPGSGSGITVSGSGRVCIGISRTPDVQFFECIDGVANTSDHTLHGESCITNEISFCAWRFRLNANEHLYQANLARVDDTQCLSRVVTNAMPRSAREFDSRGIYRVGLMGLVDGRKAFEVERFDCRVFTRWLTEDELCRIHANGITEMNRRGIPQWQ